MNKILFKLIEGKGKFFLMRDYPEKCTECDSVVKVYPLCEQCQIDWDNGLKKCTDEALKNGEIVNPEVVKEELWKNDQRITNPDWSLWNWEHKMLADGDTFDLPEGLSFESVTQHLYTARDAEQTWCDDNHYTEKIDFPRRKVIRLLPEKPEPLPSKVKKNLMNKALWLKDCLDNGWSKDQLDGLSEIWDRHKDEEGNLKPVQKEESQDVLIGELWYRFFGESNITQSKVDEIKKVFTIKRKES